MNLNETIKSRSADHPLTNGKESAQRELNQTSPTFYPHDPFRAFRRRYRTRHNTYQKTSW